MIGKYRIVEEIGRGGFATVYRAVDTTLAREVALKVLDPLLMRDTAWVDRFHREARTVAALDHPHIVTIHEIAEAEGRLFIAMKLIRGPDLSTVLSERGALPWSEVTAILNEVAGALDHAHGQGMLHRDLKPGNVLLDPQRGAILTDFGFARLVSESSMSVSLSGGVVGTPEYIAPEVWHGQSAGVASDVYALGCVLYEMVLGQKAFAGESPPAVMMAHFQPVGLPDDWPEGVPEGIGEVLRQALAQEPDARYESAGALRAAVVGLTVDPLAEPYGALEAAVAAEDWEQAQTLAGEIQAEDPDYREVAALAERAEAGWMAAQREAAAAPWRAQAEAAMEDERWAEAQAAVAQWLRLVPEDADARTLQARLAESKSSRSEPVEVVAGSPSLVNQYRSPVEDHRGRRTWGRPEAGASQVLTLAEGVEMVFVGVPAGPFLMGSDPQTDPLARDNEQPQHEVDLDGYWMAKYPVTNAQFQAFAAETGHPAQAGKRGKGDHPVVYVSWQDAVAFCEWATEVSGVEVRLPSEAEWEKAARGVKGRIYPWGDEAPTPNLCNFDSEIGRITRVGKYSPQGDSVYGCADMAGNVWEWVGDWYDGDYYAVSLDSNPEGPADGTYRVLRGGAFLIYPIGVRCAFRSWDRPLPRYNLIGFRVVVSPSL
jgi:serine/threonine-protein kinase